MEMRNRKVRVTFLYLFLIGMLIVAVSLLAHRVITEEMISRGGAGRAIVNWLPFVEPRLVDGVRVGVLRSEQTADFFAELAHEEGRDGREARENYLAVADFWEDYFVRRQMAVERISDHDLVDSIDHFSLLVLPMAHCLSKPQIEAVKDFLAQRRGVLFTHISGNRGVEGEERSWSLTGDVVGGEPSFLVSRGDQPRRLHLLSAVPVAANAPPAFELAVHAYDQPIGIRLRETRSRVAGMWAEEGELLPKGVPEQEAGMAFGDYLGGRFAWFGFSVQSVAAVEPEMWRVFDSILDNAVDWTASRMVIGKAPWPRHQAAAAFAVVPERGFVQAADLRKTFNRHQITPGFFLHPRQALVNRVIIEEIAGDVEFALQTDLLEEDIQETESADQVGSLLRSGRDEIKNQAGAETLGFNIPIEGEIDFQQLADSGFDYAWIYDEHRRAPKFIPVSMQPLFRRHRYAPVLLFQGGRSDRYLMEKEGRSRPEEVIRAMRDDFNRNKRLGGLYSLTLHSHLSGGTAFREELDKWLEELPRDEVWVASPGEIARWWRSYEQITVSVMERGRGSLTLLISNESSESVPGLRLHLYPAAMPETLRIRAERIYVPVPDYRIDREKRQIEFKFEELSGRENRTYYLDFSY